VLPGRKERFPTHADAGSVDAVSSATLVRSLHILLIRSVRLLELAVASRYRFPLAKEFLQIAVGVLVRCGDLVWQRRQSAKEDP
jgi:hypothetical protein